MQNAASETVHLTTKNIKHCDVATVQRNQQLSWLFFVAQTPWPIIELTFVDDDASQCELSVEQQNTTILRVRYKYVTVRVNGNVLNVAEWWQMWTAELT